MNFLKKITAYILLLAVLFTVVACGSVYADTKTISKIPSENSNDTDSDDYRAYLAASSYDLAEENLEDSAVDHIKGGAVTQENENICYKLEAKETIDFLVNVPENRSYNIELCFKPLDEITEEYKYSLTVDGKYPFSACENLVLNALWEDDGEIRTLSNGDQIGPLQKHTEGFVDQTVTDCDGIELSPYVFHFTAGIHTVSVKALGKEFLIEKIRLVAPEKVKSYKEAASAYKSYHKYDGKQIVIEAEKPLYKNGYSLSAKSDSASASVSPSNPTNAVINYIGGSSWKAAGSEITWKLTVPEDGLYKLGIAFKQNFVTDGEVYRWLKIDGKTPFEEATALAFPYSSKWQFKNLGNDSEDYLIYLTEGEHTLSLAATLSDISEVFSRLKNIVEPLGDLYLDIVMITGESPDKNRDYELHNQIPDFENVLNKAYGDINSLIKDIGTSLKVNGELNGALKNMSRIIKEMTDNLYDAHLQVSSFYSAQQTLSAWLYDIKNTALSVDQIILAAPDKEFDTPKAGLFDRLKFFLIRYIDSYKSNKSSASSSDDESLPKIKIWVNWGRDQVRVLNSLIQDSFSAKNNVNVLVEQVNATLVQGVISGNSPDLYLHMARTEPINLAMRGVLYDLKNFDDFDQVVSERYFEGAQTPYIYKDGVYALADTQTFFVMFYRKDIFDKMELEVPKTWDEFLSVTGILQRNKMNAYLPYTKLGAAGTVNIGAGGLTIFPTMLIQRGGNIYNSEKNATELASSQSISAFKFWTEFYTEYSLDQDANFYQKFRTGTIPLGIASYTNYLNFKIGAPEIYGKWGIAEIPGIIREDGAVDNTCSGAGTGVSIMKSSKNKDAAWEFVKWWTSAETQYRYSADVEAIIGETGRVSSANPQAVSRLSWDSDDLDIIINQWKKVKEVPEVPGSYYVSRSIDQAFWATKNGKKSAKEAIVDWSVVCDNEIKRKIDEYANKNYGG